MRKIILTILLVCATISTFAQENENKSESKALDFMSASSALMKKESYDLGSVKGVKCQVLIITNVLQNTKIGCLRLETSYYAGNYSSDSYIGTLDYDEIEDCISSINYIKDNVLPNKPASYTEIEYSTRDNIEVGAYYNTKKSSWTAYVYTKSYTSRSAEYFDSTSLSDLVAIMVQAKNMIAEKIQQ